MEKLFLLIRSLHTDPNIAFYPEKSVSSAELKRIKALLEQCSDEALSKIIPIIESVIRTIASKTPEYKIEPALLCEAGSALRASDPLLMTIFS